MQDRRHRPGDVLDDYCPRERRITDHAIVAMIDDHIQKTRCASCDAEHDYKEGKVPAPRRKTQPPALFTQVLETMNGPVPPAAPPPVTAAAAVIEAEPARVANAADPESPPSADVPQPDEHNGDSPEPEENEREGGFRRSLIRATFPRPDGQAPTPRANPEFTIQSLHNRRNNNGQRNAGGPNKFRGGRRRPAGGGGSQDNLGPMRFRDHGSQQGQGGQGQGQGQGGGRRRRGGKKNR
jgi:hypothetical protein